VIADPIAERLSMPCIATIDDKMVGMMNPVCRVQPLQRVLQEIWGRSDSTCGHRPVVGDGLGLVRLLDVEASRDLLGVARS
jgi:hypothetical protein